MEFVDKILEWPIIVQGALGSALFWIVLVLGQKIFAKASSKFSQDRKSANEVALLARASADLDESNHAFLCCLYGASHYLIKAILVVTLSLLISPFNNVIPIAGYLIAVYYLFRGLSWAPHFDSFGTLSEARVELKKLEDKYASHNDSAPNGLNSRHK